jgi:voltage-gated sodium channel
VHLFGSKSPEYFKDLKTSLFSMHQVVTGDSWASGVVRSLFDTNEEGVVVTDANIALFFVSYFIISNVLLLNVVIAVLLDEFIANVQRELEEREAKAEAEAAKRLVTGVLDPITENLIEYQVGTVFDEYE